VNRWRTNTVLLAVLLAGSVVLAYSILRPFLRPIVLALVIGIGFGPLHARIGRRVKRRNLSALISTLAVLLIFVVPAVLLVSAASSDITHAAQYITSKTAQSGGPIVYLFQVPERLMNWLGKYVDLQKTGLRGAIDSLPLKTSQFLVAIGTSLVTGLASFVGEAFITLFVLFFVFRDGPAATNHAAALLPLDRRRMDELFFGIRESVFANLYGILAVGLAQGLLTSAGLAIAGIGSPLLLGIAAAVCSLIPLVGPSLVWLPAAVFLFATGHWGKALFLIAWGIVAVGTADNIIRPLVIVGRVKLHPLLLLFALIGGVQQFGFVGLFIGPVVMSLVLALSDMLREDLGETKEELRTESTVNSA
jgi:predicted PurR-regulated permease PerM